MKLGLGLGLQDEDDGGGGPATPPAITAINISAALLTEHSAQGTAIGTLSAVGGTAPFTWSIVDDDGDRLQLDGSGLEAGSVEVEFDTDPTLTATIHVVDALGQEFEDDIVVTVEEEFVAPFAVAETINDNDPPGTLAATITYPDDFVPTLNDDCGGRMVLANVGSNSAEVVTTSVNLIAGWERPIIGVRKSGATASELAARSQAYGLSPTITINAVRTPASFSGLQRGFRAEDASVTGTDVNSIPGAWGTSDTATGTGSTTNKPQFRAGVGPGGKALIAWSTTAAERKRLEFTTFTGTVATLFWVLDWRTLNAAQLLLGHPTGPNTIRTGGSVTGTQGLTILIRVAGMAAEATFTLPAAGRLDLGGNLTAIMMTIDTDNDTATVYVGNPALSATATLTSATGFSFSQLGSQSGGNTHINGDFECFGAYDRILDATERTQLMDLLIGSYAARDLYYATDGNDANTGFNSSNPKQSVGTLINTINTYGGQRIVLKRGQEFQATQKLRSPQNAQSAAYYCKLTDYGNSNDPPAKLTQSPVYAGVWTEGSTSGGVTQWETPHTGVAIQSLWMDKGTLEEYSGLPDWQLFESGDLSVAYQFVQEVGVDLTISLPTGIDPNDETIRIPTVSGQPILGGRNFWHITDLDICWTSYDALDNTSGTDMLFARNRTYYTGEDGLSYAASRPREFDNVVLATGSAVGFNETDTQSDSSTIHSTVVLESRRNDYIKSTKHAIADQEFATRTAQDIRIIECNIGMVKLGSGSGSGTPTSTFDGLYLKRPAVTTDGTDTADYGIKMQATVNSGITIAIGDAYFDGSLGTVPRGKCVDAAGGTFQNNGNITQTGFNSVS